MNPVTEAVVLMAGTGSRLRAGGHESPKPLVHVMGRPLVAHIFESLARAGIKTVHAIVGYNRDTVIAAAEQSRPGGISLDFIDNPAWEKQNGVSVLAARKKIRGPFLLTMTDHLFDQAIVDLVANEAIPDQLNLAVDYKITSIFDLADATKVQTRGDRIIAIGKTLESYNAIDTGMFVCPPEIFDHLERAKKNGDCSLSDGVLSMASENKARAMDIGDAWWQDVDTPEMLATAEARLKEKVSATPS